MPDDELEKLAEQQAAILEAMAAIKNKLDADEWRRKCLWLLASISRNAESLKVRFPGREQTFKEIMEPLDCYANLVFKSPSDLHTLFTCFTLIAGILENQEKAETPSLMELWQQIHPLIDELGTLESGDPPSLSAARLLMRSLHPEEQDAERAAVRERFDQRSRESIKEMFARRKAEAENYY
jgi:hypothetical protein